MDSPSQIHSIRNHTDHLRTALAEAPGFACQSRYAIALGPEQARQFTGVQSPGQNWMIPVIRLKTDGAGVCQWSGGHREQMPWQRQSPLRAQAQTAYGIKSLAQRLYKVGLVDNNEGIVAC
jgi:hypothetical protein